MQMHAFASMANQIIRIFLSLKFELKEGLLSLNYWLWICLLVYLGLFGFIWVCVCVCGLVASRKSNYIKKNANGL